MLRCPKCDAVVSTGASDCSRCGELIVTPRVRHSSGFMVALTGFSIGFISCLFFWGGKMLGSGFQVFAFIMTLFCSFIFCNLAARSETANLNHVRLPICFGFTFPMLPMAVSSPGEWMAVWFLVSAIFAGIVFLASHAGRRHLNSQRNVA